MLFYYRLVLYIYFLVHAHAEKQNQFTQDKCPLSTFVPNEKIHATYWSSPIFGNDEQGALSNFMSIHCPTQHFDTFKQLHRVIQKKTIEGTEEHIQFLALALTFLYHHSRQHQSYLSLAISDVQPLHIYFLSSERINKLVPSESINKLAAQPIAIYYSSRNSLFFPIKQSYISRNELYDYYEAILHELRHRVWHVVNSQLLGRPSMLVLPQFPHFDSRASDNFLQGQNRLFVDVPTLLEKEFHHKLTKKEATTLAHYRSISYKISGELFLDEIIQTPLTTSSLQNIYKGQPLQWKLFDSKELKIYKDKHFKLLNVESYRGDSILMIKITDPLVMLIKFISDILSQVEHLYPSSTHAQEKEAYIWNFLSIQLLRAFFPEMLKTTSDLIELTRKNPRSVNYNNQLFPRTSPLFKTKFGNETVLFLAENLNLIDKTTAEYALMSVQANYCYVSKQSANCQKILTQLITLNLLAIESRIEYARLEYLYSRDNSVCQFFKDSLALRRHGSRHAKLSDYDLLSFSESCLNAGDKKTAIAGWAKLEKTAIFSDCLDAGKQRMDEVRNFSKR